VYGLSKCTPLSRDLDCRELRPARVFNINLTALHAGKGGSLISLALTDTVTLVSDKERPKLGVLSRTEATY
jgi:hypothetical protein